MNFLRNPRLLSSIKETVLASEPLCLIGDRSPSSHFPHTPNWNYALRVNHHLFEATKVVMLWTNYSSLALSKE
jgi:hypothetical protein